MIRRELNNFLQPIVDGDGDPVPNLQIIFRLVDSGYSPAGTFDSITSERIMPLKTTVITNAQGEFSVNLWPTSRGQEGRLWHCEIRWPGSNPELFTAPLVEGVEPLKWADWARSGWTAPLPMIAPFAAHMQDSSKHLILPPDLINDYAFVSIAGVRGWRLLSSLGSGVVPTVTADITDGLNYRIETNNGILSSYELAPGSSGTPVTIIAQEMTPDWPSYQITTLNGGIITVELAPGVAAQNNILVDASNGQSYRIITISGDITTEEM